MPMILDTILSSAVARRAGVPQATTLRRYEPGQPLVDAPVLLVGAGAYLGTLRSRLQDNGVHLVDDESSRDQTTRLGAVVLDLSDASCLADLDPLRTVLAPAVKRLSRNARVVVIGTDPRSLDTVTDAVTHRALEGFVRSLGKELRGGSTANLVLGRTGSSDGVGAAVEFLLSGRSAYVDGQVIRVDATPGPAPAETPSATPLAGKVAVVTGAARGIGAEIATVLARDGATVVCVDVPAAGDALARVANAVRGTALQLDVTAADAGQRIVAHAVDRHGSIDLVVHNAGITRDKLLVNMDEARWDAVLDVNLGSVLRMNEAVLADGAMGQGGRIVCVSSIAGIAGNRGQTNYGMSKAGVIGLVDALATAVRGRGITVNAVAPGFIETEMTQRVPFATREIGRRMNSLQQGGRPRDVAEAIAWLAQPGSGAVTGQVLRVCGQSLLGA
ncbi:MAG: 3-oxoacyl-ACP reductase [Terracoccus sp.]